MSQPLAFNRPLQKLRSALRTLDPGQGRVARTNARARARAALKALRTLLDEQFPMIPKEKVTRRSPLTEKERRTRLESSGYIPVRDTGELTALLKLGVKVKVVTGASGALQQWAPDWAATIYRYLPVKLVRAVNYPKERQALKVAAMLMAPTP